MSRVLVDLLRFIAANEDLPRSLARYPGHTRDTLGRLLAAAADRLDEADAAAGPPAKGNKGLKVRKGSEVERAAAQSAQELDEAMNLSKVEREKRKAARAKQEEAERAEAAAAAAVVARPPRTRMFVDGAARGNPGPAGAGAVILNADGHVMAKVGKFLGESTNNVAEYMGLILGLRRAKAMGIKELDVFSDSELMVKQLNGDYAVKAEHLVPLHAEAKALVKGFAELELRHVPREENTAADAMSNRAIDERL